MKVGDIVRVRLKSSPDITKIGIVVRESRKMFMVGDMIEVLIDGHVMRVNPNHAELVK